MIWLEAVLAFAPIMLVFPAMVSVIVVAFKIAAQAAKGFPTGSRMPSSPTGPPLASEKP